MASRNRIYDIESGYGDDDSDESEIVPANPNASAAAYLARKSPSSKKDDSLSDSSLEDIHPDVAAGVFLSRFPKSVPEGNLIQRMNSATLSDSSDSVIRQVDPSTAAAAFLARNIPPSIQKPDTSSSGVNSDDDSESGLIITTDPNAAAAVFLSANSAAGNSRKISPKPTEFAFTIPDGDYTAEHFANVPDEWLEGL
jgi:hypothetical protein